MFGGRVSFDRRCVVDEAMDKVTYEVTVDDTPKAVGDCDISAPAAASERGALSRKSRRSAVHAPHQPRPRHASPTRRNAPKRVSSRRTKNIVEFWARFNVV